MNKAVKPLIGTTMAAAMLLGMAPAQEVNAASTVYTYSAPTQNPTSTTSSNLQSLYQEASKSKYAEDIKVTIDTGVLAGHTDGSARLKDAATGSQAAAFLFRAAGIDTGKTAPWDAGVKVKAKEYGVIINDSKQITVDQIRKLAQGIQKEVKNTNVHLLAFDEARLVQLAEKSIITREDMLLLSQKDPTPPPPLKVSSAYKPPTQPTPPPPPPTPEVIIAHAEVNLQDTPAVFKGKSLEEAKKELGKQLENRKYGSDIKEQLKQELKSGKVKIDTKDKNNAWVDKWLNQ